MSNTIPQWSTYFYVDTVKQHSTILSAFENYIEDESFFSEPWIYSNCKSTCQNPKNEQLPWNVFFDAIKPNLEEYLQSLDPQVPYFLKCEEVWLNVYGEGGYQEIHDHAFPNRSFACSYILELPEEDVTSGALVFENTDFPIIQMSGLNRIFNSLNCEKFIPNLANGTLVIFPSWTKHYVLPNRSSQRRVTISANFIVEGNYR